MTAQRPEEPEAILDRALDRLLEGADWQGEIPPDQSRPRGAAPAHDHRGASRAGVWPAPHLSSGAIETGLAARRRPHGCTPRLRLGVPMHAVTVGRGPSVALISRHPWLQESSEPAADSDARRRNHSSPSFDLDGRSPALVPSSPRPSLSDLEIDSRRGCTAASTVLRRVQNSTGRDPIRHGYSAAMARAADTKASRRPRSKR